MGAAIRAPASEVANEILSAHGTLLLRCSNAGGDGRGEFVRVGPDSMRLPARRGAAAKLARKQGRK